MKIRYLRLGTHAAVLACCVFVMMRALTMAGFLFTDAFGGDGKADRIYAYIDSSPIATAARLASVELSAPMQTIADASVRAFVLAQVVSNAPALAVYWRELASMRWTAGDTPQNIVSALAMSIIMSPNDANLMASRIPIELMLWEDLPQEGRSSAIADMIFGSYKLTSAERVSLGKLLNAKSKEQRTKMLQTFEAIPNFPRPLLIDTGLLYP